MTMIRFYGHGPDGAKCGQCAHLIVKEMGGRYFKCDLTQITAGPATDWRKKWPACGAFEAAD